MVKKIFIVSLILFTLCFSFYRLAEYRQNIRDEKKFDSLRDDITAYPEVFIGIMDDNNWWSYGYKKITKQNYDKTNDNLVFIFEELGYVEIYSDGLMNVYFDKYGENFSFFGVVYLRSKSKSVFGKYADIGDMKLAEEYDNRWVLYKR